MKRTGLILLAIGWAAANAAGGIISFEPAELEVTLGDPGNSALSYEVAVSAVTRGSFDAIDIVIGSEEVPLTGFTYAPAFEAATIFQGPPSPYGYYAYDLGVGGFNIDPLTPPVTVGTLTVDASGLAPGVYAIMVNSEQDLDYSKLSLGQNTEPVNGVAALRIVTEPGTDPDDDGTDDSTDALPEDSDETTDTDTDGGDDSEDVSPDDPEESTDLDDDGTENDADSDDDDDGVDDAEDALPEDSDESADTDGDGVGDQAEESPDDSDETIAIDGGGGGNGDNGGAEGGADQATGTRLCGAGLLGPWLFMLLGLATLRHRR